MKISRDTTLVTEIQKRGQDGTIYLMIDRGFAATVIR